MNTDPKADAAQPAICVTSELESQPTVPMDLNSLHKTVALAPLPSDCVYSIYDAVEVSVKQMLVRQTSILEEILWLRYEALVTHHGYGS